MTTSIGPGVGVVGTASTTTRIGTLSPYDFAYWASTFVARGTPASYSDLGPETDGVTLIGWSATQIGVTGFPTTLTAAKNALTDMMTVDDALRTRGSILVGTSKLAVSLGLNDIIDIINGRYFIRHITSTVQKENWIRGARLPGANY